MCASNKPYRIKPDRITVGCLAIATCLGCLTQTTGQTWSGGGANDQWTTKKNWDTGEIPADDGTANLIFAGTTRLTPNLNKSWDINSILFGASAGAFTIAGGHELTLEGGGIANDSSALQTLSVATLSLGAAQTWSAAAGDLTINSSVNNNGHDLTVSAAGGRTVTLNSPISGGGGLRMTGSGTLILAPSSANTFSGATTVDGGILSLNGAGALGATASITVNTGGTLALGGAAGLDRVSDTAVLTLNGGTLAGHSRTEAFGALDLPAFSVSTIDLELGNGSGTFTFGSLAVGFGAAAVLNNGTGSATGGTDDRIFLTSDTGLIALDAIVFNGFSPGAARLASGELVPAELVPVPEPPAIFGALALAGFATWRFRERRRGRSR
jgi:autotransporter-associated beta strand protein